jgi:hypothetical protein
VFDFCFPKVVKPGFGTKSRESPNFSGEMRDKVVEIANTGNILLWRDFTDQSQDTKRSFIASWD